MRRVLIVAVALGAVVGSTDASTRRAGSIGKIVWVARSEGTSIVMVEPDGTRLRVVVPAIYRGPDVISSFEPMLSPDGQDLVFTRRL